MGYLLKGLRQDGWYDTRGSGAIDTLSTRRRPAVLSGIAHISALFIGARAHPGNLEPKGERPGVN
jgi:hypothetical protein